MIEECVPSDTYRDDFYEQFMERRVQKLINPKETTTDDSIPFPIVPLSSTPTVLSTKRISNTSDDSGVNSSAFFSYKTIQSNQIFTSGSHTNSFHITHNNFSSTA